MPKISCEAPSKLLYEIVTKAVSAIHNAVSISLDTGVLLSSSHLLMSQIGHFIIYLAETVSLIKWAINNLEAHPRD